MVDRPTDQLGQQRPRRKHEQKALPLRRHKTQFRPEREIAVEEAGAERRREFLSIAGRGDIHPVDLRLTRPHVAALELGIAGDIPRGKYSCFGAIRPRGALARHAHDTSLLGEERDNACRCPDRHAGAAGRALEPRDERARVRQHVVHARLCVRRLRHGAVEPEAVGKKPAERVRHGLGEDTSQGRVVAVIEVAVESRHVAPVLFAAVADAGARLMRRAACGHGSDRPGGRSAQPFVLLEKQDARARRARLDRGGKPRAAAADHDHIECALNRISTACLRIHALHPRGMTAIECVQASHSEQGTHGGRRAKHSQTPGHGLARL